MRRYSRTPAINLGYSYGTSYMIPIIRNGIANGTIRFEETILDEAERLDIIAGKVYQDGLLWWIIAAASDIGNALQVPPGTRIKIPNLSDIAKFAS